MLSLYDVIARATRLSVGQEISSIEDRDCIAFGIGKFLFDRRVTLEQYIQTWDDFRYLLEKGKEWVFEFVKTHAPDEKQKNELGQAICEALLELGDPKLYELSLENILAWTYPAHMGFNLNIINEEENAAECKEEGRLVDIAHPRPCTQK